MKKLGETVFNKAPTYQPRLMTRSEAAQYCRLSNQAFSQWVKLGRLPEAIPGTARWDLKSIDRALDVFSCFRDTDQSTALDQWKAKHARST